MKVCENCGVEIGGGDADTECPTCEAAETAKQLAAQRRKARSKERDVIMRSLGLVKVKGALGGTYWE